MNTSKICILVCCHEPVFVPAVAGLVPIQVGAALAESHFEGFLHDDMGDHISEKNPRYSELTALYWAWKNYEAYYYGLFHYRRYVYPARRAAYPYRLASLPNAETLEALHFEQMQSIIPHYDMILPIGENMYLPVREHYAHAPFHHGVDLQRMEKLVQDLEPAFAPDFQAYLNDTIHYFGNICIMRREVFTDYCAWLFPLLDAFDQSADLTNYNKQEMRVDGYLAERLLGAYYLHYKAQLRVRHMPRVHFTGYTDQSDVFQRLKFDLLPPGSRRRALVKRGWQTIRGDYG